MFRSNSAVLANSTKDQVGHIGWRIKRGKGRYRSGDDELMRLPIRGSERRTSGAFVRNCTALIDSIICHLLMSLSRHSQSPKMHMLLLFWANQVFFAKINFLVTLTRICYIL